jgi:3-dehydroquinate dehydratase / shikimate dehydrogenase
MICVTIARTRHKHTIAEHQRLAEEGAELCELRLDYIGRKSIDLAKLIKQRPTPVIVTCRRKEDGGRWSRSEEERLMMLRQSIAMGADYVDLEFDIAMKIPRYGKTKRIVSLHNFEGTPEDLFDIHAELSKMDADIVKIAAFANSFNDVEMMFDLMKSAKVPTIGISMGETGTPTRILASRYNAPFTYCVYSSERRVAPGQLTFEQMKKVFRVDSINEDTTLYGVVADPVAHSYSPLIHNSAFAHDNLNARYLPFRVPPENLRDFLKWCPKNGVRGLSVTIPHKETIMDALSSAEAAAQEIGAVNTVVFDDQQQMLGFNTDYRAAMDCLSEAMKKRTSETDPFKGRNALLLGAGGVNRAIGYGLRNRGAILHITSRSMARTEHMAAQFNATPLEWAQRYDVKPGILVNGTPVGMFPDLDNTPYDPKDLDERTLVFDTVYNPENTMLLKMARGRGCATISGMEMFVRQAAYQYKLFTGQEPPVKHMVKTLRKAISPAVYSDLPEEDESDDDITGKIAQGVI